MININLLPEEARKSTAATRRSGLPAWLPPVGLASIVTLAATTMTLRQIQDIRSLDEEITALTQEKDKYKSQVALIDGVEQRRDDLEQRVTAAHDLDRGRGTYVKNLGILNDVVPPGLWLTAVTEEAGGRTVRIEGRSLGPAPVFALMRGLDRSESFDEVNLEYLKKDPDQEMGATSFVLTSRTM